MISEQLKKAVLQAAIQGKLTEQLPEDGNAKDLLVKIQTEKSRLIKTGEINKEKHIAHLSDEDIPFEIPHNWCWCFLQDISIKIHYGFTAKAKPSGRVKMLRITDIQENSVNWEKVPYCKISDNRLPSYILKNRDIVIARTGGTVGKTYIVNDITQDSVFASYLIRVVLSNKVYENYVKFFMESELYWQQLKDKSQGTGQPNVNGKALKGLLLPLPPLNEQYRIVTQLEKILPEIEILRADEIKLDTLQQTFPTQMKASILQAAMKGKLTEQFPSDGNARELLREIQAEKSKLVKEGKIKKGKPLPEITEDEIPFDIPDNWCWVRLGEIGIWSAGATPLRSNSKYYKDGTIPWVRTGDLNDGLILEAPEFITDLALRETSVKLQPVGTVLIAMYGATIGKIGVLGIEATTNQACCGCNLYSGVLNWYLFYYLMSHKQNFINQGVGGAQPNISREKIVVNLLPLPPLAEQQRIVQRLEELLPLCDALE
ncbi:MAG TPA: restriction endonuclease subunit S [Clostridiales bacterium]|nr:restriction endonuclease subunit S [Clostridiales bacterium]